jgi:UDP-N-acetyl-2-amino-2-deoxyglucuronate dehydrogenase
MSTKNIKIAIVGCGRIAGHHIRAIKSNSLLTLVAICDMLQDRAKEYSEEFKIPFFTDYNIMLSSIPDIDIVVIATPSGMHFEHSYDILEKYRKNLIVEKPTFMHPDQLVKIVKLAKEFGKEIFPVFQNRYNIAVQRVKRALIDGELGDIRIMNVRLRWCRPQRYYDLSDWRGTFSHDGGAITNQGIHHIDLLRYLGGEVEKVNAIMRTLGADIEVEDSVVSIFTYDNGSIGSLEVTTAARPDDFEASLSIVGSKGIAQLGGIAVNKLEIFTPKPEDCITFSDDFSDLPDRGRVYGRGHAAMYRDISSFFIDQSPYPVSIEDCESTLGLLHSFYSSDEIGGWVNVKEKISSTRLGRMNDSISELYRTS